MKRLWLAISVVASVGSGATSALAQSALTENEQAAADELTDLVINGLITQSDRFWHQGDYRSASKLNLMGSYLDPTYEDGYDSSAWLVWSLGYDARAIRIYEAGIKANPNSPVLRSALGQHYVRTNRPGKALEAFFDSLRLSETAETRLAIGHCYKKLGYPYLALRQYDKAVEVSPDNAVAARNARTMRERLGLMSRPFAKETSYLSIPTYVQRLHKTQTGEGISPAEARHVAAEMRRDKRPLYVTQRQREAVEEALRPPLPDRPMGPPFMGPMGPTGPGGPGVPPTAPGRRMQTSI